MLPMISLENNHTIFCVKQGKLQDRMAGGKEEYNAFFYSLVSTDTQVIHLCFVVFNMHAYMKHILLTLISENVNHLNAGDVLLN